MTPTTSGYYWLRYKGEWSVVLYDSTCNDIAYCGDEMTYTVDGTEEWGPYISSPDEVIQFDVPLNMDAAPLVDANVVQLFAGTVELPASRQIPGCSDCYRDGTVLQFCDPCMVLAENSGST